jgi:hypothetical protein
MRSLFTKLCMDCPICNSCTFHGLQLRFRFWMIKCSSIVDDVGCEYSDGIGSSSLAQVEQSRAERNKFHSLTSFVKRASLRFPYHPPPIHQCHCRIALPHAPRAGPPRAASNLRHQFRPTGASPRPFCCVNEGFEVCKSCGTCCVAFHDPLFGFPCR